MPRWIMGANGAASPTVSDLMQHFLKLGENKMNSLSRPRVLSSIDRIRMGSGGEALDVEAGGVASHDDVGRMLD